MSGIDYDIKIELEHLGNEVWWIAYCDELGRGSCYGLGDTPEEALVEFLKDKESFIAELHAEGRSIPKRKEMEEL